MDAESPQDLQATFCATLVDEWVLAGLSKAVISPGSRSTPLALALAESEMFDVHVVLDERSASFMALGIGLASAMPAVLLTTSGTATAHLLGAVAEADLSGVPMIVCTADRPPELHGVGAAQTIEQAGLFAGKVRWSADPGVPAAENRFAWRSLGARSVIEAMGGYGGRVGPVHLNLAFREPLIGRVGDLPAPRTVGPWHNSVVNAAALIDGAPEVRHLAMGDRGIIVAGAGCGDPAPIHALAERLGWPVLADARSGARIERPTTVATADALLRDPLTAERLRPEVVFRFGAPWASKVLNQWLAGSRAEQVLVDANGAWWDPDRTAEFIVRSMPDAFSAAFDWADLSPAPPDWLSAWTHAEQAAQQAMQTVFDDELDGMCEPAIARHLTRILPEGSILVVSSSMPVRDVEWFGAVRSGLRVLANRGANGIDGVTSTVLGAAASDASGPVVGLIGDLAFLHDSTALLTAASGRVDVMLVVIDNHGGAIFEFLPQAGAIDRDRFEQLFGTPQQVDLAALVAAHGIAVTEVRSLAQLEMEVKQHAYGHGARVLIAHTDRRANVEVHERINRKVAAAVHTALDDYDLDDEA